MKRLRSAAGTLALLLAAGFATEAFAQPSYGWGTNYLYMLWNPLMSWRLLGYRPRLAGRELNGTALGGRLLDGRTLASVSFVGVAIDGDPVTKVKLRKTRLTGVVGHRRLRGLRAFAGARLSGTLDDGTELPLRIDRIDRYRDRGVRDVLGYEVSYATDDGWSPLCGRDDDGAPIRAIPLNGRWSLEEGVLGGGDRIADRGAFTFGCEDHVIGKCVLAGYKPWRTVIACARGAGCVRQSLAPFHQACTRALRADYCGDGASHTVDGVMVSLYDGLGIRVDDGIGSLEAEWDADGALCVATTRWPPAEPGCIGQLARSDCGDPYSSRSGALLMSELIDVP